MNVYNGFFEDKESYFINLDSTQELQKELEKEHEIITICIPDHEILHIIFNAILPGVNTSNDICDYYEGAGFVTDLLLDYLDGCEQAEQMLSNAASSLLGYQFQSLLHDFINVLLRTIYNAVGPNKIISSEEEIFFVDHRLFGYNNIRITATLGEEKN